MHRSNAKKRWILCMCTAAAISASCTRNIHETYRRDSVAAAPVNGVDEDVRRRVQAALHDDPTFFDRHVEVSVAKGHVTLDGFVFDDGDLGEAVRIARAASDGMPVISNLTMKVVGGWR